MRNVFDGINDLIDYLKSHPHSRQTPYLVSIDGIEKYTLSSNGDQAIATLARKLGAHVESVPLNRIINHE